MRSRPLALGAVLASASLLALAQPSAAAHGAASQAPAKAKAQAEARTWSAAHGNAAASGTRWLEPGDLWFNSLHIEGELKKTGSGCSTLWVQWTFDLAPMMPQQVVTQCGAGSEPVDITLATYRLTTTGRVAVCRGDTNTADCGAWESVTTW